ncbi:MAG: guanosine monophosphate reductase, partial [Saprospiraceae bacterium]|nr:guanosine monophosphate reductase [Saprospiraceae bacterium]
MAKFREDGLSFDDVLLVPQHSEIASRSDVDLGTNLGGMRLSLPILSANMDTVTDGAMAVALGRAGGAGVLHRFAELEDQMSWVKQCHFAQVPVILSVGIDGEHDSFLVEANPDAICVDVAHGDHSRVVELVQELREAYESIDIIAGNVATRGAAMRLVEAGANIIKVGIGPGSVCSTRVVSGHGVPQLTAILDVCDELAHLRQYGQEEVFVIADGGIRYPGDIVKALAAGADAV